MGNCVTIVRTEFHNVVDKTISYGFRMYDDYGQSYNNNMSQEDMQLPVIDFYNKIKSILTEEQEDMIDPFFGKPGVLIDGEFYEFNELDPKK